MGLLMRCVDDGRAGHEVHRVPKVHDYTMEDEGPGEADGWVEGRIPYWQPPGASDSQVFSEVLWIRRPVMQRAFEAGL